MCPFCELRRQLDELESKRHAENVELGSVLILEEPDVTVVRIFKPMSKEHRSRLLALMSEIDSAGGQQT